MFRGKKGGERGLPRLKGLGQGSGVLKGHTDVLYTLAEQCNITCVSRATSGRLRLNDETLLGVVEAAVRVFTSLRENAIPSAGVRRTRQVVSPVRPWRFSFVGAFLASFAHVFLVYAHLRGSSFDRSPFLDGLTNFLVAR